MGNSVADEKIIRLRRMLLKWGTRNARTYPWRYSQDAYAVLISELMLHRTQTRQVEPIFTSFIAHYPDLEAYARASKTEVLELLQPLGLNWRIYGMITALDTLWEKYREVPADYEKLIAIRGIGQYIAGATVCFTQNEPLTLVDSNIVRVMGRIHDLDLRGEARRKKPVLQAITEACDPRRPRDFYYALIDLAHQICRPVRPACPDCPLLKVPCLTGHRLTGKITENSDSNLE
jgi:A/G-specific adenine glycosylase